ncbi:hypothetical protein [Methylocystis sp.]|uniref:hypothetical protein n=1 Tax=Methylocystis sp. TaxID=1911079 RepID=UPI0025FAFB16|nr:hypothetical protein [Methylocystis sp.]
MDDIPDNPQVLIPYDRHEACSISIAAKLAGRSEQTIRNQCKKYHIGRRIGGQYEVSKPAHLMLLDNDTTALRAYLAGDRTSERVLKYFERAGVTGSAQKLKNL